MRIQSLGRGEIGKFQCVTTKIPSPPPPSAKKKMTGRSCATADVIPL